MWIMQKNQMVFAGTRLALVTVDQNIFGLRAHLRHKAPLHSSRESSSPTPAKSTGLHLIDDPLRPLRQTVFRLLIAAQLNVLVNLRRAHSKALGNNLYLIGMRNQPWHQRPP